MSGGVPGGAVRRLAIVLAPLPLLAAATFPVSFADQPVAPLRRIRGGARLTPREEEIFEQSPQHDRNGWRFSRPGAGYPRADFSGSRISPALSPCRAFAPLFPHIPVRRLDTARKTAFVHYRRFAHHPAQRFAQLRKNRLIARELDREPHVVLRRRSDPRLEPDRRKNA